MVLAAAEGLSLHKRHPVRVHTLTGFVSKEWLLIRESQYLADLHLGFVPLEDQLAIGGQHAEAPGKALGQVLAPVIGEYSVLSSKPAITSCASQVRRIEDDHFEGVIFERQAAKIHDDIGLYVQYSAITEHVLLIPNVSEQGSLVVLVEPEHTAATAGIEDFDGGGHGVSSRCAQLTQGPSSVSKIPRRNHSDPGATGSQPMQ